MTAVALDPRRYRWVDRFSKLVGVALIAGGIEAGGATLAGIALAVAGVGIGLLTTVIRRDQ